MLYFVTVVLRNMTGSRHKSRKPNFHLHGSVLVLLLLSSLVVDTASMVIQYQPPSSNTMSAVPFHENRAVSQHEHDVHSSVNKADITWYSSGAAASRELFFLSKQYLAGAAFKLYSRLPANKTGLNTTFILHQIDPFYASDNCNSSKIIDVCSDILIATLLITGQNETAPFLWPQLVITLMVEGSDAIKHFYDFGCYGQISISRDGRSLIIIPENTCPKVKQVADVKTNAGLSSTPQLLGSTNSCYGEAFTRFTDSDVWRNCLLDNPILDIAVLLALGGLTSIFKFVNTRNIKSLNQRLRDTRFALTQEEETRQSLLSKNERLQKAFEEAQEKFNKNLFSENDLLNLREQGERMGNANRKALENEYRNLKTQYKDAEKTLQEMKRTVSAEQKYNAKLTNDMENLIEKSQAHIIDKDGQITFDKRSYDSESAEDNVEQSFEQLQNCVKGPLLAAFPGCEEKMEKISTEGIAAEQIEKKQVPMKQEVVDNFADSAPELVNVKGRAPPSETLTADTETFGEKFGIASILGEALGFVGEIANFMIMFGIIGGMINRAMEQIEHSLQIGFTRTYEALNTLANQEREQFLSLINHVDTKIQDLDAKEECSRSWSNFRAQVYIISAHHKAMTENLAQCKGRKNYTGDDYYNCEFVQVDALDIANSWEVYQSMGNFLPGVPSAPWEKSLAGEHLYQCSRHAILQGYSPEDVASLMESFYRLSEQTIDKAGLLYRWSAGIYTGHSKAHGGYLDYGKEISDGVFISVNQTRSFGKWFTNSVVPPALAGYFSPSIWSNVGALAPGFLYRQIEMLNVSTFASMGYLTPSLWLPEVPIEDERDQNNIDTEAHSISNTFTETDIVSSTTISPNPPPIKIHKEKGISNATATAYALCQTLQCLHSQCTCRARTISPCACREGDHTSCDCTFLVQHSFRAKKPARGWVGVYKNDTDDKMNYLAKGKSLCTLKDKEEGSDCIPGVLLRNAKNNIIHMWANATYKMQVPSQNQWEYNTLKDKKDVYLKGRNVDKTLFFQMVESSWGWKFGDPTFAAYLETYFSHRPSFIVNLNQWKNVSSLMAGDGWRMHWAIADNQNLAEASYVYPMRIFTAETAIDSKSNFGFSCPHDWLHGKELDGRCGLLQEKLAYPSDLYFH